jgi:hypothetical protein
MNQPNDLLRDLELLNTHLQAMTDELCRKFRKENLTAVLYKFSAG